jgi:hypothetical protein
LNERLDLDKSYDLESIGTLPADEVAIRKETIRGSVAAKADDFAFLAASAEASWLRAE